MTHQSCRSTDRVIFRANFDLEIWTSLFFGSCLRSITKCSLSHGKKTRKEEEEERRICHAAQWGTQQRWLLGHRGGRGASPQPRRADILNRHPPRDGSQLHGGVTPLTIHGDGACANTGGPPPCLPACLMKGKWAPEHRRKRKEAFGRIKITPSECVAAIFERGLRNIPLAGFKLPTSELRNTEIKCTAALKQLARAQMANTHHCAGNQRFRCCS